MFAELLKSKHRKSYKTAQKYVNVIVGETDRVDRMVTTILDSAKIDGNLKIYEFRESDLVEMTKTALSIMDYQLKAQGFRVESPFTSRSRRKNVLSETSFLVLADRDAVILAITNLIGNAIKYSASQKYLKVSLLRTSEYAVCRIRDKGVGISPDALPHLFKKFYRDPAHSQRTSGVGLGLPLVRHIMDAHRGTVEVESVPGKGSTFSLSFRIVPGVSSRKAEETMKRRSTT